MGGQGGRSSPPQRFEWGIEYLISPLQKFDLLGLTLLIEVSEIRPESRRHEVDSIDLRPSSQVVELASHRQQNVFQPPTRKHLKSRLQLVLAIIFLF